MVQKTIYLALKVTGSEANVSEKLIGDEIVNLLKSGKFQFDLTSISDKPLKRDYITAIFDRTYELEKSVRSTAKDPKDITTWAMNSIYNAYMKVIQDLDLLTFYTNYIKEK